MVQPVTFVELQTGAARLSLRLLALAALLWPADASAFLQPSLPGLAGDPGLEQEPEQQRAILEELEAALGEGHRRATEARVGRLEGALNGTFAVLPKLAGERVGAAAARYALHRLFVQLHGWQVKGLETAGESWAGGSPAEALGERLSGVARDLFEQRIARRGLDLHELAVLGATWEGLIHSEAVGRLQTAYRVLGHEPGAALNSSDATAAMNAYMAIYVLGANASAVVPQKLLATLGRMDRFYPNWPEVQKFLQGVRQEVAPGRERLTFESTIAVVEEAGERFGRWQDSECRQLKDDLLQLEEVPGSGRVRLADFYNAALHQGKWQFRESPAYLRQLGAIDDSEPEVLRVIIPNYVNGPSNCIASSAYYGVCCIDECEALLGHLERQVGAPSASPEKLASLVAGLPSSSVPGNRTLAPGLIRRLGEVAERHGGQVPLHGRLFGQWLHHAYPRECPFPHTSGTTRPVNEKRYKAETGRKSQATREEMEQHLEAAQGARRAAPDDEGLCSSMWSEEEELVDPRAHELERERTAAAAVPAGGAGGCAALRLVAMLAAVGSLGVAMAQTLGAARAPQDPGAKAWGPAAARARLPTSYSV